MTAGQGSRLAGSGVSLGRGQRPLEKSGGPWTTGRGETESDDPGKVRGGWGCWPAGQPGGGVEP